MLFDPTTLDFAIRATAAIIGDTIINKRQQDIEELEQNIIITVSKQTIPPPVPGPSPGYTYPVIENTEQYCPHIKPGTTCPMIFTDPKYNAELRLG